MEAARDFIANHTARRGHRTNVHETIRPAITSEHIHPSRHEIITEAIDRESHQHHYHTVVQPLSHKVTLPTKHTHNLIPIRHVTHQHDDVEATKQRVASEAALFRHSSTRLPTTHTQKHMPMVIGAHYHHHVHETVQPIIYKEVIAPEIVHTTIPIHERHHMKAVHHTLSALPAKTMAEFEALKLSSRGMDTYEGPPREYESNFHTTFEKLALGIKHAVPGSTHTHHDTNVAPLSTHHDTNMAAVPGHHDPSIAPLSTHHDRNVLPTPANQDRNLTIRTTPPPHHRKPLPGQSRSSSVSSNSSLSSIEQPKTPRSPRTSNNYSKPMTNLNSMPTNNPMLTNNSTPLTNSTPMNNSGFTSNFTTPTKTIQSDRPVQIANTATSPRYSDESTGSGNGRYPSRRIRRF